MLLITPPPNLHIVIHLRIYTKALHYTLPSSLPFSSLQLPPSVHLARRIPPCNGIVTRDNRACPIRAQLRSQSALESRITRGSQLAQDRDRGGAFTFAVVGRCGGSSGALEVDAGGDGSAGFLVSIIILDRVFSRGKSSQSQEL